VNEHKVEVSPSVELWSFAVSWLQDYCRSWIW